MVVYHSQNHYHLLPPLQNHPYRLSIDIYLPVLNALYLLSIMHDYLRIYWTLSIIEPYHALYVDYSPISFYLNFKHFNLQYLF